MLNALSSRLSVWFQLPSRTALKHIIYGVFLGFYLSITSRALLQYYEAKKRRRELAENDFRPIELRKDDVLNGVAGLIGNTPLIRINSLSDALGVEILGKAEYLNPGGSVKDRVALRMIEDAEKAGLLHPHTGSRIFEGTVGSTGISIATIARARGYEATIIMPDDVAEEKVKALLALGAHVERVRPASIIDKKQYVNMAKQLAAQFGQPTQRYEQTTHLDPSQLYTSPSSSVLVSTVSDASFSLGPRTAHDANDFSLQPRGFFADQFENRSNFDAHFHGTGPEIWRQTNGRIHAFISGAGMSRNFPVSVASTGWFSSAGTGGTIAGVGQHIKSRKKDVVIALADPEGSGLYNKVKHGVMYDHKESEGTKRRHQVDTVVEGIGINRLTNNIELALPIINHAFRITDAEAVSMSRYLVINDGLFLGSSSACNLVACVKLIKQMGWRDCQTVVTILCDSGTRHYSKVWNDDYLRKAQIPVDIQIVENLIASP
ncbi:tryptophan synthase beta subunit-like PLP-dependent enzyme [Amanita rubescens]|nr:tryptophan synthase beta subunit-like PLP-dependent enzyme [Amanita rubescens]